MSDIKRYDMTVDTHGNGCSECDIGMMEFPDGEYVKHSDHLAALEAAKKEAVVEWLKSVKAKCGNSCDPNCKFGSLCYMRAMYWDDEAVQKAAEV